MERIVGRCVLNAIAMCMALLSWAGVPEGVYCRTSLFKPGDAGSKFYRIPALLTAADGSIIAAADKRINCLWDLPNDIDVVCRRSTDMGATDSMLHGVGRRILAVVCRELSATYAIGERR